MLVCALLMYPSSFSSIEPAGLFGSFMVSGSVKYTSHCMAGGGEVGVSVIIGKPGVGVSVIGMMICGVSVIGMIMGGGVSLAKNGI